MTRKEIFVGRKAELKQFDDVLRSSEGQAVLVVGQQGMGKTMLVNKMAERALGHPDLNCGCLRYEVTPTDSVDSIMELMLDHAFDAAKLVQRSIEPTDYRRKQWISIVKMVVQAAVPRAAGIVDVLLAFRRDPKRNTRDQFLERLQLISTRMPENGRAIFIIDPEKYMQKESDQAWAIVVRQLPPKVKFLFAQRPDDALASSADFRAVRNLVRIPDADLDILDDTALEELLQLRAPQFPYSLDELRAAVRRYQGHPYAVPAALDLIQNGLAPEELPGDPTPEAIAESQWGQVCRHSPEAIRLFKAHAILEVAVPGAVVQAVSDLDSDAQQHLFSYRYLAGLLRQEADGRHIYHSLLADHVDRQISPDEADEYHRRAVDEYRRRLSARGKPDALAATRLPEHVLLLEGPSAFVETVVDECTEALHDLALVDLSLELLLRALRMVTPGSLPDAFVKNNLGVVYRMRGELGRAEDMHRQALKINEGLRRPQGVAMNYSNLGLIYQTRGDFDEAEPMHRKALEIDRRLGLLDNMARHYSNLGAVYQMRGDLRRAVVMHLKALEIDQQLANEDGLAKDYGNLGLIYYDRGDYERAEILIRAALHIEERRGAQEGIAVSYGNLGLIFAARGHLKASEDVNQKALAISERLGLLEGIAASYRNLGAIAEKRGQFDRARELWTKARDLYQEIGIPRMVKKVEGWLHGLSRTQGQTGK